MSQLLKDPSQWHSYSVKVSPIMSSRLVDGAKGVLNNFLPDVYIYADHMKGKSESMYVYNYVKIGCRH